MVFIRIWPQTLDQDFGKCTISPVLVFARKLVAVEEVSTVTLLAEIIERSKSTLDANLEPSPVAAPE